MIKMSDETMFEDLDSLKKYPDFKVLDYANREVFCEDEYGGYNTIGYSEDPRGRAIIGLVKANGLLWEIMELGCGEEVTYVNPPYTDKKYSNKFLGYTPYYMT